MTKVLIAVFCASILLPAADREKWPVRDQETIHKTFHFAGGGHQRFVLENVSGYVHVTAGSGSDVQMQAHKVIRAAEDSDLQDARKEITLDIQEKPQMIAVYYDSPWRCRDNGPCHDHHRSFYEVTYDFDVTVPRDVEVVVSTVNRGDVTLDGAQGHFEVSNVNGPITITNVNSGGDVHSVNGNVNVAFNRNPREASSFRTVNGQVDITFQPGLSADLMMKTFNGSIFSDFDVQPRAVQTVAEQTNGKFVYRSNRFSAARVGQGGPELRFDTLNGNIRLHQAGK